MVYGFVQGGAVRQVAIGPTSIRRYLPPNGDFGGGPGEAEQPIGPGEPTLGECRNKYLRCIGGGGFFSNLWFGLKATVNLVTLDIEDLEAQYEERKAYMKKCVGDACARVLDL